MNKIQDTILWKEESDNYTERAKQKLGPSLFDDAEAISEAEKIISQIPNPQDIRTILDLGCAYGEFSKVLAEKFPKAKIIGIDPGAKSIQLAKKSLNKYKNLQFIKGYSHDTKLDKKFDLIILRMVLQWIPRSHLLKTISEVDRLSSRFIYVKEFNPQSPKTSISVHNKKVRIFKQDYSKIFTSLPFYRLIFKETENLDKGDDFLKSLYLIEKISFEESYIDQIPVQEKDKK